MAAAAAGLVALWAAPAAQAATINVTPGAVDTVVNGNCSLLEAITAANTDTAVDACPAGSISGTDTINANGTFVLTLVDNTSSSGANGLPLITSAITINGATITRASGAPAFRILEVKSGGNLTLNSVTVSGGLADSGCPFSGSAICGGGIANNGTLTVNNSKIVNNSASGAATFFVEGGGIDNDGTATIVNSQVTGNSVTNSAAGEADGGGIANDGTLTVRTSQVKNNTVTSTNSGGSADGGGIANFDVLTVTGSQLAGNTVSDPGGLARGGGLYSDGSATLTNSQVTNNTASAPGGTALGGGIFYASSPPTLNSSQVAGNTPDNCEPNIGSCT